MTETALELTQDMPVRRLAAGEPLFGAEQDDDSVVAVLVSGRLRIVAGDLELSVVDLPGSFVGEVAALLGTARTAQVIAVEPSELRVIGDPDAFFSAHPDVALELARQLAGRLYRLIAYLSDVREQYADREDHLGFAGTVLGRIATRAPVTIEPGSTRAPDC